MFQGLKKDTGCFRWEAWSAARLLAITRNGNCFVIIKLVFPSVLYLVLQRKIDTSWIFAILEYVAKIAQLSKYDLGPLVDIIYSVSFHCYLYPGQSQIFTSN